MDLSQKLFNIYKSSTIPQIDLNTLRTVVANYFYLNGKINGDKLDIYNSLKVESQTVVKELIITNISIRSSYSSVHLDILIIRNRVNGDSDTEGNNRIKEQSINDYQANDIMIMISSSYTKILLQLIDQCNKSIIRTANPSILKTINLLLSDTTEEDLKKIGNVELVFETPSKHLSTIAINIPTKDLSQLSDKKTEDFNNDMETSLIESDNSQFINNLYLFMHESTKLNFRHLRLIKFLSNGVYLSPSRVKIINFDDMTVLSKLYQSVNDL